ncbi:hypothetical protein [Archangium lipolyticum]|uniref:hypothetical protein n=1 Tax=Archangium lipolyticum TaxID=2970465 RepID=UPI002149E78E|nr:hypothetical protein [Archangium lipolyticum]
MPFTLDDSLWPLLVIHLSGTSTDVEYEKFLEQLAGVLNRREPYFSIVDTSQSGLPNSAQRQRQVEWSRTHDELERTWGRGTVFIVTSPFVRVAMSLYFHVRPQHVPHVSVADMGSALVWIAERMESTGFKAEAERVRQHLSSLSQRTA